PCPHCGGQGIVRSVESTALRLLRGLEEEAQRLRAATLSVRAPTDVAIYALNRKRHEIAHIEAEYRLAILFEAKEGMLAGTFEIERIGVRPPEENPVSAPERVTPAPADEAAEFVEASHEEPAADLQPQAEAQPGVSSTGKRRRRRRRGRDRERPATLSLQETAASPGEPGLASITTEPKTQETASEIAPAGNQIGSDDLVAVDQGTTRKRRRRRRGRRGSRENGVSSVHEVALAQHENVATADSRPEIELIERDSESAMPNSPAWTTVPNASSEPVWSLSSGSDRESAHRESLQEHIPEPAGALQSAGEGEAAAVKRPPVAPSVPPGPPRKGWWQRPFRARE
ncbi:MAG: hypothetical protein ACREHV_09650, partial [Rhizomicrobium sp.]